MKLHVLNGDSLREAFGQAEIEGEVTVFGEAMASGRFTFLDEDWSLRRSRHWDVDEKAYATRWSSQLQPMSAPELQELTLWFEYDYFCQVNLAWILGNFGADWRARDVSLKLVCPAAHPQVEDFRGLGQLSPTQLKALEGYAEPLSEDLAEAYRRAGLWMADPEGWEPLLHMARALPEEADLLKSALLRHMERLPATSNGCDRLESWLLAFLMDHGPSEWPEIFRAWWQQDDGWGWGDLQVEMALEGLCPDLVSLTKGKYQLTEAGKEVSKAGLDRMDFLQGERWIGASCFSASRVPYRWNYADNQLISAS